MTEQLRVLETVTERLKQLPGVHSIVLNGSVAYGAATAGSDLDLLVLCEMGNEFEDESLIPELEEGFAQLEQNMEAARLQTLLTGEYDSSNVILTVHPGAGGTEAQDWATGAICIVSLYYTVKIFLCYLQLFFQNRLPHRSVDLATAF